MAPVAFRERLINARAGGRTIMMDGAMGTELVRKGLQFNTEDWLRINCAEPDVIGAIHSEYALAGAEIHIANSFAAARHVLDPFGLGREFNALNRAAVAVCRDAIDRAAAHDQWVAGSISTFAPGHDRNNLPDAATHERNVADQAAVLADAGADLIALEMVFTVDQAIPMLKGAMKVGLPVSLGFVCNRGDDGTPVLGNSGVAAIEKQSMTLAQAIDATFGACPPANDTIVTAMHSDLDHSGRALAAITASWGGASAIYPNTGHYKDPGGWDFNACCSPDAFVAACGQWVADGATIVGGCCGFGPDHIRALGKRLDRHDAEQIPRGTSR